MCSKKSSRLQDIHRFYQLMDVLEARCGGKRLLSDCNGKTGWPGRGIYFFFEAGETRSTSGDGMRVVRVGTHALKTGGKSTLWGRLRQHRGSLLDGSGNHRGSVFRLHVGKAIIQRGDGYKDISTTWGAGSSAPRGVREIEKPLEKGVSQHISNMPFLWLAIDDPTGPDSLRGYIERNAIGLLSNYLHAGDPIDPPTPKWLGRSSESDEIRRSGLWNVNHIRENYAPTFLDALEDLILA